MHDAFNRSRIDTTVAVVLTANLRLLDALGDVLVPTRVSGLPKYSIANVSQLVALDRSGLTELAGKVSAEILAGVNAGLRLVLTLIEANRPTGNRAALNVVAVAESYAV